MKLSEFDKISFSLWRGSPYSHTVSYKDYARCRREGAEAAGVVWDPEGPLKLPANLIVVKTGQEMGRLAYRAVNNAIGELTLEELDEVKRRCDAWPELEKLAEKMGPGYGLCGGCEIYHGKLLTILRGGPQ